MAEACGTAGQSTGILRQIIQDGRFDYSGVDMRKPIEFGMSGPGHACCMIRLLAAV